MERERNVGQEAARAARIERISSSNYAAFLDPHAYAMNTPSVSAGKAVMRTTVIPMASQSSIAPRDCSTPTTSAAA